MVVGVAVEMHDLQARINSFLVDICQTAIRCAVSALKLLVLKVVCNLKHRLFDCCLFI